MKSEFADLSTVDPARLWRFACGAVTPADRQWFDAWVAADPTRRRALEAFTEAWSLAGDPTGQVADTAPDTKAVWDRLMNAIDHRVSSPLPLGLPRSPAVSRLTWRRSFAVLSMMTVVVGGLLAWHGHYGQRLWSALQAPAIYTAVVGERRTVVLSDGTQVTLAPASFLRVPSAFATGRRTVQLTGEAYFAVVHDAHHPFVVVARDAVTRDVGTAFAIRAYPEDRHVQVAVVEGRVRVGSTDLSVGDLAVVADSGILVTHAADIAAATAWMQGRLVFDGVPLRDVVRDLARTFDLQITITDSTLAHQHVTGAFDHLAVDEVLDEVTRVSGAQFERHGRVVVIRRAVAGDVVPAAGTHPVTLVTRTSED